LTGWSTLLPFRPTCPPPTLGAPCRSGQGQELSPQQQRQLHVVQAMPPELLAFSLSDGRSGVLQVKGSKLTDLRPKRPFDAARGAYVRAAQGSTLPCPASGLHGAAPARRGACAGA
jgi:hypothetical protein